MNAQDANPVPSLQDIAASLAAYDPQALSVEAAQAFLAQLVQLKKPVVQTEQLPLPECLGRVLAQDVVSPIDVPAHDNSAMDGYAFHGQALSTGEPLVLRVVGTALAGQAWRGAVGPGECLKIMTGAILPPGLDTVLPQELVQAAASADSIVVPPGLLRPGDNRRLRGEDLAQGQVALRQGQTLTPARWGLAASLGLASLPVRRPLRVAYFSTGNEILSLGEPPREGAVYDSNRYTVLGMLARLGCTVIDGGVVPDDPVQLEAAFRQAGQQADAVITSGGVSVGEADFTKTMMRKLGDVAFWRIAMRPGRPMAVGRLFKEKSSSSPNKSSTDSYQNNSDSGAQSGAILFGLPGNPVAVVVTFLALVRPALLRMMGADCAPPLYLKARSQQPIRKKPGRTEYQRGWVSAAGQGADGVLQVTVSGQQGSGVLRSVAEANALVVLHHAQGNVAVGDTVDVWLLEGLV